MGFATELGAIAEEAVERLCRLDPLTADQRTQPRLPPRDSGVGFRAQNEFRGVGYLGSWLGCVGWRAGPVPEPDTSGGPSSFPGE